MIKITFPDGSVREYESGVSGYDVAMSISPRLAADVLAVNIKRPGEDETSKGTVIDVTRPITEDVAIRLLKWEDDEAKRVFWHSSSHLMAEALEALFPGVKFGIGPAIENGFYYDVDMNGRTLTDADFKAIEDKMLELARGKEDFRRIEVSKADAMAYFKEKGDEYKQELISELEDGTITYYTNGHFTDLCRGPHLRNTEVIKAVKVLSLAGAYWRGDESRQQLTRIYGITFPKKSLLDEYLVVLEEARKRDNRKIGKEMELFTFSQRVGPGLPLWLPKGAALRYTLENFLRKKQAEYGY
ncbi:MAG: threonine--tRNA ligase, partial [Bacteroidales bacterium]|nr:threonine--tRNA ligase [Bacteroidales bacterium]